MDAHLLPGPLDLLILHVRLLAHDDDDVAAAVQDHVWRGRPADKRHKRCWVYVPKGGSSGTRKATCAPGAWVPV